MTDTAHNGHSGPSLRRLSASSNGHGPVIAKGKARALSTSSGNVRPGLKVEEEEDDDNNQMQQDDMPVVDLEDDEDESLHCAICLSLIDNQTSVQPCMHDAYCFACILAWTEQSRRCPLCTRAIEMLVHSIRSDRDYQKYYLPPLPSTSDFVPPSAARPASIEAGARRQLLQRPTHPRFKYADWKARNRMSSNMPEDDAEEIALMKRKYVYRHRLFVKHVASNRYTKYREYPAQQISSSTEQRQRLSRWARREFRVFDGIDVEFLTGYVVNIASQLELRSDGATRLLAEFLGEKDAEHFLHEAYSFMRSPYKDIRNYDRNVQYDRPENKIQPLLPSPSPPRRRPRSGSLSSISSYSSLDSVGSRSRGDGRRTGASRRRASLSSSRRRRSSVSIIDARPSRLTDRRAEPVARKGRDLYIPDYAKVNKGRNGRQRSTRGKDRPVRSTGQSKPGLGDRSDSPPVAKVEEALKADEPMQEEVPVASVDSDLESVISLGDFDAVHEDAPASTDPQGTLGSEPKMQISVLGRGKRRAVTPTGPRSDRNGTRPAQIHMNNPRSVNSGSAADARLFSFRGQAKSAPDVSAGISLLHRLSGMPQSRPARMNGSSVSRPADADPAHAPTSSEPIALRKGTIGADLQGRLMQRLQAEKEASSQKQPAEVAQTAATPSEDTTAKEDTLRRNVLAALAARRATKVAPADAETSLPHASPDSSVGTRTSPGHPNAANGSAPPPVKMQTLKERMEKEKRLASLKSKLLEAKATLKSPA